MMRNRDYHTRKYMHAETLATDDRLYQMNHCVSIPMIFVSAIFASLITPDDACDTYCQNGAYCQNA